MSVPRTVSVLGSTGSIGTQALDVIAANPERFRIVGLASAGRDPVALAAQALSTGAEVVAVARASAAEDVLLALYAEAQRRGYPHGAFPVPKVLAGPTSVEELAAIPVDVCLNALTGSLGLAPTLAALGAGSILALANKESLIAGGTLVTGAAAAGQIVPVDSEHSALAQCLRAGRAAEVRRLVLTASGGPFRGRSRDQLRGVTLAEALAHPTWTMGPMNTINSATLVNKGLELIEAHLLFSIDYPAIDVVVHPESLVHSMVEFTDGSTVAHISPPDMRLPISLALGWPDRVPGAAPTIDWTRGHTMTFEPLDSDAFPAVALARHAGERGGMVPCAYNAANEVAAEAFVDGRLDFGRIVETVACVVEEATGDGATSLGAVLETEAWARSRARNIVEGS